VSRSTLCTLFFYQSFQSKIPTQRKHTLSASARSIEHLRWLPAKMNTCVTAMRLGDLLKVVARNICVIYNAGGKRKISDTRVSSSVTVLCKDEYLKMVHFVQLQIIHLLNHQCNVPLMRGNSVISEPLVNPDKVQNYPHF